MPTPTSDPEADQRVADDALRAASRAAAAAARSTAAVWSATLIGRASCWPTERSMALMPKDEMIASTR